MNRRRQLTGRKKKKDKLSISGTKTKKKGQKKMRNSITFMKKFKRELVRE